MNQPITPQFALERLFTSSQLESQWFAPNFLAKVPLSQVEQVLTSLRELGTFESVQKSGTDYLVVFQKGSVPTQIVLDANGRISGLLFQNPRANISDLNQAVEEFKTLPGQVSFLVLENGSEKVAWNPDKPLAVGSAFKLAVLDALNEQIAVGQRSWSDVLELRAQWKSCPSGILQNWPYGIHLTLESLAALMISQSDNTATDALIDIVGRGAIELRAHRNHPFLTTREAFILKSNKNSELLRNYRTLNKAKRRVFLDEVNKYPLPELSDFDGNKVSLDIEWFFTVRELCELMEKVRSLPLMSINPGVAKPSDWERIAYKGGSELGVLNFTTWLQSKNGQTYFVVATWNNYAPLDEVRFISIYSGVIDNLK